MSSVAFLNEAGFPAQGRAESNKVLPENLDNSSPSTQGQESRITAWEGLRNSLRNLVTARNISPLLSVPVNNLIACLDGLEVISKGHRGYDDMAAKLEAIIRSLERHVIDSPPALTSGSVSRLTMVIDQDTTKLRERLDHHLNTDTEDIKFIAEELGNYYRQIQFHLQKIKMNASMCAGSIANEELVNKRLEILNPANQATYDSSISTQINRRGCTEGTRVGVLDGLEKWLYDLESSPIYWINGMAGTGKTTIASTFCKRFEQQKLLVASFFCTRSSTECKNVAKIIPTLAYQIARYSVPFQAALCEILDHNSDMGSKNILKQFEYLLEMPLKQTKDTMPENLAVVIDALDECDDRNGVELILDILCRRAAELPLKFLVTSRPEPEIYGKMSAYAQTRQVIHLHNIEESLVRADIELYLEEDLGFISPSRLEIEELARRSGTLFIYAATLVRYIHGKRSIDPRKRLQAVLDMDSRLSKRYTQIDTLYTTVIRSALNEELEAGWVGDIRAVLRVVLLAQEPISVETIASLGAISNLTRVTHALQPLRSVLHQSKETSLVSTLHASFPDFMFDQDRSGSYYCDVNAHSESLAQRCFALMGETLRFNICDLVSSFVPDEKVEGIRKRVKQNISPTLSYACRHWADHLFLANGFDSLLIPMLDDFMSNRLLFWMEVLNLLQEISMAADKLLKTQQWLRRHLGFSTLELITLVDDARSFVTGFSAYPSSKSTPHIYISSLAFCPRSSLIHKYYWKRTRGLLELRGSLMERREAAPVAIWSTTSEVKSLTLSPDGTRVAIGCLDDTVSILSTYDGTVQVGPLEGHTSSVDTVSFSQDGGRFVSGSLGSIRIWNAYNGTQVAGPFKGHMRYINCVSFSPDGKRVVSCGHDCTIRIWNSYDGTPLLMLTDHTDLVLRAIFSPDGAFIASGSADRTIRLWVASDGTPAALPFEGHTGWVDSLAFTPNGAYIISGSSDKTIRVWNIPDGTLIHSSFEGYSGGIVSLAISPDSTRVAAGSNDCAVRVWRVDSGKLVSGPFFGHTKSINSVTFFPDGTRIISGSSDKTLRVWNIRDGMLPPPPPPPQNEIIAIRSTTFCTDSIRLLSSDAYGVIRIWNTSDGTSTTIPDKGNFFPTPISMLSPDGSFIASTSKDGKVQIMSSENGSLVAGPFDIERSSLSAFWFSRSNKAILMGCHDGMIKICDLRDERGTIASFRGHPRGVSSLTESPDCTLLASYSDHENVLRVWNTVAPALDLDMPHTSPGSYAEYNYSAVYDGWDVTHDGWVVNSRQHLLFWLPPDIASAWCSPYAKLVITHSGTLQVPKQRLIIGDKWTKCYTPE